MVQTLLHQGCKAVSGCNGQLSEGEVCVKFRKRSKNKVEADCRIKLLSQTVYFDRSFQWYSPANIGLTATLRNAER